MKKLLSVALAAVMACSLMVPALAADGKEDFRSLIDENFVFSENECAYYSNAFKHLSDQEYNEVIGELVMSTENYELLTERLELCGIAVGCIKDITDDGNNISVARVASGNITNQNDFELTAISTQ